MRDRLKKGNKDRRNQPPGGTPEVCAFPPTSQSEVNLVCHCNHSILQSVGIVKKKDPREESEVPSRLMCHFQLQPIKKETCDKQAQKNSTIATHFCPMLSQDGVN